MNIGDKVEWSFGGLATVTSHPFKEYGQLSVRILPCNTGDPSTGYGTTRVWPVAQLKLADMTQWSYDPINNYWTKKVA